MLFKKSLYKRKNEKGFTLFEILIVMGIVGALITLIVRPVIDKFSSSKVKTTRLAISQVAQALTFYSADCGRMPKELKFLKEADPECPSWGPNPYMRTIPKDGWSRDFIYESDGGNYTLRSFGADGKEGGTGNNLDINSEE
jgi:general secretion pathway protein G